MTATFPTRTAAEYREMAARSRKASADSWERSDTDGYLTQWACDSVAREYDVLADLVENGGKVEAQALFFLDGTLASADRRHNDYGYYWLLNDEAAERFGKRFVSESNARKASTREKNYAKKGFAIGTVKGDGVVVSGGNLMIHYMQVIARNAELEIVRTSGGDPVDY